MEREQGGGGWGVGVNEGGEGGVNGNRLRGGWGVNGGGG